MTARPKTHVLAWLDAVRDADDLDVKAKAVALVCATYADYATGENMRAATSTLAAATGLSDRATRYAISALREAGLLTWDGRPTAPGVTRTHRLTLPTHRHPGATEHRHDRATDTPEHRHPGATDGGERWHHGAATVANPGPNGGTGVQPTKAYQGRPRAGARTSAPPVAVHPFADDGNGTCSTCSLPGSNARHRRTA